MKTADTMPPAERADRTYRILYAGPGLSGRTANLEYISAQSDPMRHINTKRILIGSSYSLQTSFAHLHGNSAAPCHVILMATPGPIQSRQLDEEMARLADGVVFVIDSQTPRVEAGCESIQCIEERLRAAGRTSRQLPCVLQYNKRDLPGIETIGDLQRRMNEAEWPAYESVARTGQGVIETLNGILLRLTGHAFQPVARTMPDQST